VCSPCVPCSVGALLLFARAVAHLCWCSSCSFSLLSCFSTFHLPPSFFDLLPSYASSSRTEGRDSASPAARIKSLSQFVAQAFEFSTELSSALVTTPMDEPTAQERGEFFLVECGVFLFRCAPPPSSPSLSVFPFFSVCSLQVFFSPCVSDTVPPVALSLALALRHQVRSVKLSSSVQFVKLLQGSQYSALELDTPLLGFSSVMRRISTLTKKLAAL
jgi:hypothetical protein